MYYPRMIDGYLLEWSQRSSHKPLLLRGARQVGKSTAVRHLSQKFKSFVEVNFERQPSYKQLFQGDIDVKRIVPQMAAIAGKPIEPGSTLLFLDEIQACPEAIMSLRFFKEDMPELHVIAAGSLLEFALEELPTFGVGRIHSMFMFPMTFDEFLLANGENLLIEARNQATSSAPLPAPLYEKLVGLLRTAITHFYYIYLLSVIGFQDVLTQPIKINVFGSTNSFYHCKVVLADAVMHKFGVYSFGHNTYAFCG